MNTIAGETTTGNHLVPVRRMHPSTYIISTRLLNADGTEPPAGTPALSITDYPETRITEYRYKLDRTIIDDQRKFNENFLWLSNNNPLLFEAVLSFLEAMHKDDSVSVTKLLDYIAKTLDKADSPTRHSTAHYIYTYYQQVINTTPLMHTLAADGYHGGSQSRLSILFNEARTATAGNVDHPHFKAIVLAVWITQTRAFNNPLIASEHEAEITLIHERFQEVYDARHELRTRNTIDSAVIEEVLRTYGPLRTGVL